LRRNVERTIAQLCPQWPSAWCRKEKWHSGGKNLNGGKSPPRKGGGVRHKFNREPKRHKPVLVGNVSKNKLQHQEGSHTERIGSVAAGAKGRNRSPSKNRGRSEGDLPTLSTPTPKKNHPPPPTQKKTKPPQRKTQSKRSRKTLD